MEENKSNHDTYVKPTNFVKNDNYKRNYSKKVIKVIIVIIAISLELKSKLTLTMILTLQLKQFLMKSDCFSYYVVHWFSTNIQYSDLRKLSIST